MTSARSNGSAPNPDSASRLPSLDELERPPEYALEFSNRRHTELVDSQHLDSVEVRSSPDEWMQARYPSVFDDYGGDIFERTKSGRAKGIGPERLFARCLGPEGSPDAPLRYCPGADGIGGEGFYRYDPDVGIYRTLTRAEARLVVDDLLEECAEQTTDTKGIHSLRENRHLDEVLRSLEGEATVPLERFQPRVRFRHVQNGILDLRTLEKHDFSPECPSLAKLPVSWEERPAFPRKFVGWLRRMFPEPDDRDLALSVMALPLIGNAPQRLVLLRGPGGTGKSTLVKLMAALVGHRASGQMRLDHLGSRFEAQRWFGKLLLHADEACGTIRDKAAVELKRLSGQDPYEAELKNANDPVKFGPRALPILVANGHIEVELNNDLQAWRRRLVVLTVSERAAAGPKVPNFEKLLLEREGPGILRLVASRAQQLLQRANSSGRAGLLTPAQRHRANRTLRGFDPVRAFVDARVQRSPGEHLYKGSARAVAREWLQEHGYPVPSKRTLSVRLNEHVTRVGGTESNSLPDHPDHSSRGWRQVSLA